jgi:hypothetical protein
MNLDDILNTIQDDDPKDTFLSKLAGAPSPEVVAPVVGPGVYDDTQEVDEELMKKVAEEVDNQGRIMARGFWDEFNKLAVGTQVADTPHPGAMPENGAMQMMRAYPGMTPGQDSTDRVSAIISQLTAPTQAGVSSITQTGNPVDYPPRTTVDEAAPIAYDENNAAAKTAGDRIIETLWSLHVSQEEQ